MEERPTEPSGSTINSLDMLCIKLYNVLRNPYNVAKTD